MKRRMLPTEVKMVEDILMEPEEDATATAVKIIRALNDKRHGEKMRIVVLQDRETGQVLSSWGPYASVKAAEADLRLGGIVPSRPCAASLGYLVTSDTVDEFTQDEDTA